MNLTSSLAGRLHVAIGVGFLPLRYAAHWVKQGPLVRIFPEQMELKSKFTAVTRRASPVPLLRDFLAELEASALSRER